MHTATAREEVSEPALTVTEGLAQLVQTFQSRNVAVARAHPLAKELFAIEGVTSLLLLGDFVTVNKRADVKWDQITPRVKQVLEDADKT